MQGICFPSPAPQQELLRISLARRKGCKECLFAFCLWTFESEELTCKRVWSSLSLFLPPLPHLSKLPVVKSSLKDRLPRTPKCSPWSKKKRVGGSLIMITMTINIFIISMITWGVGQPAKRVAGLRHSVRSKISRNGREERSPWPHTLPWRGGEGEKCD